MATQFGGTVGDQSILCDGCHTRLEKGDSYISYRGGKYCSERCYNTARLKDLKPKGEKLVKKWQKDVEQLNRQIDALEAALQGENPDDIDIAMKGGVKRILVRFLKFVFFLPSYVVWAAMLVVGILQLHEKYFSAAKTVVGDKEKVQMAEETGTTNSAVSVEQ